MTEPTTKPRRTAAEKAQDALDKATSSHEQKRAIVLRLRDQLAQAEQRAAEAQSARDYAAQHPALQVSKGDTSEADGVLDVDDDDPAPIDGAEAEEFDPFK